MFPSHKQPTPWITIKFQLINYQAESIATPRGRKGSSSYQQPEYCNDISPKKACNSKYCWLHPRAYNFMCCPRLLGAFSERHRPQSHPGDCPHRRQKCRAELGRTMNGLLKPYLEPKLQINQAGCRPQSSSKTHIISAGGPQDIDSHINNQLLD